MPDNSFTPVSDAELNAYRMSLDWYGYAEDEFELLEKADSPEQGDAKPSRGWVTIRRKATGITRHYRVCVGSRWTDEFEDDLKRGAFKVH